MRRILLALSFGFAGLLVGCGHDATPPADGRLDPTPGASVVLISIDTLRADHLSLYGYSRLTSPFLDEFAKRAVQFDRAYSHASSTGPSHMTMMTGVLPEVHSVWHTAGNRLSSGVPYLADLLTARGYTTAAFTDGGFLTENFGFDRGFATFRAGLQVFDRKLDDVEEWLRSTAGDAAPGFLFVHTYGVHAPYLPAEEHDLFTDPDYRGRLHNVVAMLRGFLAEADAVQAAELLHDGQQRMMRGWHQFAPEDLRYLEDLYDGCIHQVDAGVARLLAMLESDPRFESSWVFVVSDHGEAFNEHGTLSHRQVYEEEVRIPWLIRPPRGLTETLRVEAVVGLWDLAPTILHAVGAPMPTSMQGQSVLPLERIRERAILSYSGDAEAIHSLRKGDYKLINRRQNAVGLFRLSEDPGERDDLKDDPEQRERAARMRDDIRIARRSQARLRDQLGPADSATPLDAGQIATLKALGYVR